MAPASTSMTSVEKSYIYDVFVSFRGKDLRASFVDHLFDAFRRHGIIVFKDNKDIKVGEKISDELPKAIKESKFHIVIFSKRYADSYWCLNELVEILKICQDPEVEEERTFYPVFYDVTPSEIRHQQGPVGEAFLVHSANEAAGRWKTAMEKAANLKGLELTKTGDGHEVPFIQKIVHAISQKPYFAKFGVNDNLVGLATPVEESLLSLEVGGDDVRMIGITGMGGVGKTTLASEVFNRVANHFDGKIFVENVRERSKHPSGFQDMQKQILTSVFCDQSINVPSDVEGHTMMKRMMPNIKVLVVLDDVNHINQLEALAEPSWFRTGSRIIITSRDRQVLAHGVQNHNIHDVSTLSNEDAIRLLSRYAFKTESPAHGYEELSKKVVSYAAGLPLTIKTLSSSLRDRPTNEWEDAIERLKKIPCRDTLEILKLSFDALEEDLKEIFLHVACLLKGQTKKRATRILKSLGFHAEFGLGVLEQKSLITLRDGLTYHDEELVLHDHIEEMGKHIVRSLHPDEPQQHKLLWIRDEIEDLVEKDMGTEAIRGIKLLQRRVSPAKISESLRKMSKLCFLYVGRVSKYDEGGKNLPNSLKYDEAGKCFPNSLQFLHWDGYPYRYLPTTFQGDKLVEIEMPYSYIHQLWERGEKKVLQKLRLLNLCYSFLKTFDSAMTPNLEELFLKKCEKLVEVNISDESSHVKKLDLSSCKALEKLTISNECRNLDKLELHGCKSFRELHMHGECPSLLKSLYLSGTKLRNLKLGLTPNLEVLQLEHCENLKELVMPVECPMLTKLSLRSTKLRSWNLGLTPNLEVLELEDCEDFEEIYVPVERPARIRVLSIMSYKGSSDESWRFSYLEKLMSLEELRLSFKDMNRLPDSIYMLKHLRVLNLRLCWELKQLPEDLDRLECLELLNIPDCICNMTRLKTLDLSYCDKLEKLPDEFPRLQSLQVLDVTRIADRLNNLPEIISQLKNLVVKE